MEKINDRLKAVRMYLKLNQKSFAERLGIKQSYYSALEIGKKEISTKNVLLLFELFNVSTEWLLTGKGAMINSNRTIEVPKNGQNYPEPEGQNKLLIKDASEKGLKDGNSSEHESKQKVLNYLKTLIDTRNIKEEVLSTMLEDFTAHVKTRANLTNSKSEVFDIYDPKKQERIQKIMDQIFETDLEFKQSLRASWTLGELMEILEEYRMEYFNTVYIEIQDKVREAVEKDSVNQSFIKEIINSLKHSKSIAPHFKSLNDFLFNSIMILWKNYDPKGIIESYHDGDMLYNIDLKDFEAN